MPAGVREIEMRVSSLSLAARFLFPLLMAALLIGNVAEFQVQQKAVPNYYRPLRIHAESLLSLKDQSLWLQSFYRAQESLGGTRLLVHPNPAFDHWAWKHVALLDLVPAGSRMIRPVAVPALRRLSAGRKVVVDVAPLQLGQDQPPEQIPVTLRFLVDPEEVRGGSGVLLPVGAVVRVGIGKEWFLVPEASLSEFARFLE